MSRRLAAIALVGLGACGDNLLATGEPLAPADDLIVVAHQDDDLIFMQPDGLEAVRRGNGVTTVYVTAGNGTHGTDHADKRYEGLKSAYGAAAGSNDWKCGFIDIAGHAAEHCRLDQQRVSLVFLGYPDGGKQGEYDHSLLRLWEGTVTNVETVAQDTARYDRDGLVDVVGQVMRLTQPKAVHTLEVAATHGRDHSDHMVVGALAVLAMAHANSKADLISYRGYNVPAEPANKITPIYDETFDVLSHYEACATDCAACGDACKTIDDVHVIWLSRRYAIGFRRFAAGRLRSADAASCVGADGSFVPCETAPVWKLDSAGELRNGDMCLVIDATGAVTTSLCLGGASRRFFFDDEGHLWSGVPPTPTSGMDYAHLSCLAPGDSRVALELCGADHAPTWEFAPPTVSTPRSTIVLSATGRDVRLGDIDGDGRADFCGMSIAGGLYCGKGDGQGAFEPVVRVDIPAAPLAIDPNSLTLGDVDGDGHIDACGRDANGLLCATSALHFAAERWSPAFNDHVARPTTAVSLTAVDANDDGVADICGVDMTGVVCAPRGFLLQPSLRSAWPVESPLVLSADLDADGQADWCATNSDGPQCAVEAQRGVTTDGQPWGYAQAGMVDIAPANSATAALADIDGDGRADFCAPREDRIVCARSQGRAFGPRTATLAILPAQSVAGALWLGDLDGDGRADACVDAGDSIICAVSP